MTSAPCAHLKAAALALWLTALAFVGCSETTLGVVVPLATPSIDTLEFGSLWAGTSHTRSLTIRNSGTGRLEIEELRLSGDTAFLLEPYRTDDFTVAASAAVSFELTFAPSTSGNMSGCVTITNNSENNPEIVVALHGVGEAVPSCDDQNPCTDDHFDLENASCAYQNNQASCDDSSACTLDDTCVEGQCLGQSITCRDEDPCTRDLCNPNVGCVFIPDGTVCDDSNPCTLDLCDALTGCTHEPLPAGAPCPGEQTPCAGVHACYDGQCATIPIPNGTPCDDGDQCTLDDICIDSVCVGQGAQQQPDVVATIHTFGTRDALVQTLGQGRYLFADRESSNVYFSTTALTVVDLLARPPARIATTRLEGFSFGNEIVVANENTVVFVDSYDSTRGPHTNLVVEIDSNGIATPRGELTFPGDPLERGTALYPAIYFCDGTELLIFDLSNPDLPTQATSVALPGLCSAVTVDRDQKALLVGTTNQLRRYDITQPLLPVLQEVVLTGHKPTLIVSNGGWVAVVFGVELEATTLLLFDAASLRQIDTLSFASEERFILGTAISDTAMVVATRSDSDYLDWKLHVFDLRGAPVTLPVPASVPMYLMLDHFLPMTLSDAILTVNKGWVDTMLFDLDIDATTPLMPIKSPWHGAVGRIVAGPTGITSFSANSVHHVDISDPALPFFDRGGVLPNSGFRMFSLTGTGRAPTHSSAQGFPDPLVHHSGTALGIWADISNPDMPVAIGSMVFPRDGFRSFRTTGNTLFALLQESTPDYHVVVETFDLTRLTPGFDTALQPLGRAELPPYLLPSVFLGSINVDREELYVATAVNEYYSVEPDQWAVRFAVTSVHDLSNPMHIAQTRYTQRLVASISIQDEWVVTVEPDLGLGRSSPLNTDCSSDLVRLYAITGDTLTHIQDVALQYANHLLAFDGTVATVATCYSLAIIDMVSATLLAELPMPQPPISAVIDNDHIFVGSQSAVTVVYPPCPPQ